MIMWCLDWSIENMYVVLLYISKISNKVGRINNCQYFARQIINSSNQVRYFQYTTTLCTYSVYPSASDLLIIIYSYTDKHKFRWIWTQWNDVMNDVDRIIKHDGYFREYTGIRLIDWLNGVLRRFQQYFSHITATAHIIHAFLGFTSTRQDSEVSCPRTLPRKNPEDPVWLKPRTPGLRVKHFTTEPLGTLYTGISLSIYLCVCVSIHPSVYEILVILCC